MTLHDKVMEVLKYLQNQADDCRLIAFILNNSGESLSNNEGIYFRGCHVGLLRAMKRFREVFADEVKETENES
jgi:hypothetical protein